jgi:hypothetical protein
MWRSGTSRLADLQQASSQSHLSVNPLGALEAHPLLRLSLTRIKQSDRDSTNGGIVMREASLRRSIVKLVSVAAVWSLAAVVKAVPVRAAAPLDCTYYNVYFYDWSQLNCGREQSKCHAFCAGYGLPAPEQFNCIDNTTNWEVDCYCSDCPQ